LNDSNRKSLYFIRYFLYSLFDTKQTAWSFAVIIIGALILTLAALPETKGKSLEQIQQKSGIE